MPQEYTPAGSSQAYTVPAYADVVDGETVFKAIAEDIAAGVATAVSQIPPANLTPVTVTGNTTASLAQANGMIIANSGSAIAVTIPANATAAFGLGATITVYRAGAGAVTILGAAGVTIVSTPAATPSQPTLRAQYSLATAIKVDTNTWVVTGDIA